MHHVHLCGFVIMGMRMPRDSKVVVVSATNPVLFDCRRKAVGKGKLKAVVCWRLWEGKRTPRQGEVVPAM